MSGHGEGHGILKYFVRLPVRRTLLKARIHLKERSYPIHLGHIQLSKVTDTIAIVVNCQLAEVTKVLKQAKRFVTKMCYTKLIPEQIYEIAQFSTLATTQLRDNPAISYFIYFMALYIWYSKNYNYKLNQGSVSNPCSQPNKITLTITIYKLQ